MGRGQSLLFDLLIAFGLFSLGLVIVLFFVGDSFGVFGVDRLERDADLIVEKISEPEFVDYYVFSSRGVVNDSSFFDLLNFSYDDLKGGFDVQSDFCIYAVDADGELISVFYVEDSGVVDSSESVSSVGYSLNGAKCG